MHHLLLFLFGITRDVMRLLKHYDCKLEEQTYHQVMQLTFSIKNATRTIFLAAATKLFETQLLFIEMF